MYPGGGNGSWRLISAQKSVIPGYDGDGLGKLAKLVIGTEGVPGIEAIKVGATLVIYGGLRAAVEMVDELTEGSMSVIYDHQKGGNDIPEMGAKFARVIKRAGAEAFILFPFAGGKTQPDWIEACKGEGLVVLVGGHMTQPKFLVSEGGYIPDDVPEKIYRMAAEMGVRDFVVPGNKLEFLKKYKELFDNVLRPGGYRLYAPGFIKQGGKITEAGFVAGTEWHAIVASALDKPTVEEIRQTALELTSQILAPTTDQQATAG